MTPEEVPGSESVASEKNGMDDFASILFVNVGKADATVVLAEGHAFVIDTGTAEAVPKLFGALSSLEIDSVDGVFLTHGHDDHIGGITEFLKYMPVETIYRAAISNTNKKGNNPIDRKLGKRGRTAGFLNAGDTVPIGKETYFEVLGPVLQDTDDNDNSLVLKLHLKDCSVLFCGDMQYREENSLLACGKDLSSDVLKVGNHGNPDATGAEFAEAVSPSVVVISTDRAVDRDSANEAVLERFPDSERFITDESEVGFLLHIAEDGSLLMEKVLHENRDLLKIHFSGFEKQTVCITNESDDPVDISGYMILSGKGSELFRFPENSILISGQTCTVAPTGQDGDFQWMGEKKPWNRKKDTAYLYDRFGTLLDEMPFSP